MINSYTKEVAVAYFQGNGAKDKSTIQIKEDLNAIKDFVDEKIGEDKQRGSSFGNPMSSGQRDTSYV